MKIVTFGQNPYCLTSRGRVHSAIIEELKQNGNAVASIVYDYDVSYYVPEEINNQNLYCYQFENQHIPVFPIKLSKNSASSIYDILEKLKPDIFLIIDNYENGFFIQAIKTFLPELKIIWVLLNGSLPINENLQSLAEYANGIFCTNRFTYGHILRLYKHPFIDWNYVGTDLDKFKNNNNKNLSIFCSAENSVSYYLPAAFQLSEELKVYLHINTYTQGFYNLEILKNRYKNIILPQKCVNLKDTFSDDELNEELNKNSIFLSISTSSDTSISLFQALSTGCLPLVSSYSDKEIVFLLKDYLKDLEYFDMNSFIYESTPFLGFGEKWTYMPNINSIIKKTKDLEGLINNIEKHKEVVEKIEKFVKGYDIKNFVNRIIDFIDNVKNKEYLSISGE